MGSGINKAATTPTVVVLRATGRSVLRLHVRDHRLVGNRRPSIGNEWDRRSLYYAELDFLMILGSVRSLRAPPAIDGRTYMGFVAPGGSGEASSVQRCRVDDRRNNSCIGVVRLDAHVSCCAPDGGDRIIERTACTVRYTCHYLQPDNQITNSNTTGMTNKRKCDL